MAITANSGKIFQPPLGEVLKRSRLSNLPFLGRYLRKPPKMNYESTFKRDYKYFPLLEKEDTSFRSIPSGVLYVKRQQSDEFQTETNRSFPSHQPLPIIHTPERKLHDSSVKMQLDERYLNITTTQSESYKCLTTPPPPNRFFHPATVINLKWTQDKLLPDTTQRTSYIPQKVSPFVKPQVKHLGGVSPIARKGGECPSFSSSYEEHFKYRCFSPPPTEKKFPCSVIMGDKSILERETTHSAAFGHKGAPSPVSQKERLPVSGGDDRGHKWTTTTSDTFPAHKAEPNRVKVTNKTLSSFSQGHTDNQMRMTTTNTHVLSEEKHKQIPVRVSRTKTKTRSDVPLGQPGMEGMFYSTTYKDIYDHKQQSPAQNRFPSGRYLKDQALEVIPALSRVQMDYTPLKGRRNDLTPEQLQQEKHKQIPVRVSRANTKTRSDVPLGQPGMEGMFYSTTYKDIYDHKQQSPAQNRFPSGRYLKDQALEAIPALSRVQMDYTPLKGRRNDLTPEQLQQEKHNQIPVRVSRANTMTRSDVPLEQPGMEGMFYSTTTSRENYDHKQQRPAQPCHFPSGIYMKDQALEAIPALSRVQMDYTPLKGRRNDLTPEQLQQVKASHISFPYDGHCFTTTHGETYGPKPYSRITFRRSSKISNIPF